MKSGNQILLGFMAVGLCCAAARLAAADHDAEGFPTARPPSLEIRFVVGDANIIKPAPGDLGSTTEFHALPDHGADGNFPHLAFCYFRSGDTGSDKLTFEAYLNDKPIPEDKREMVFWDLNQPKAGKISARTGARTTYTYDLAYLSHHQRDTLITATYGKDLEATVSFTFFCIGKAGKAAWVKRWGKKSGYKRLKLDFVLPPGRRNRPRKQMFYYDVPDLRLFKSMS